MFLLYPYNETLIIFKGGIIIKTLTIVLPNGKSNWINAMLMAQNIAKNTGDHLISYKKISIDDDPINRYHKILHNVYDNLSKENNSFVTYAVDELSWSGIINGYILYCENTKYYSDCYAFICLPRNYNSYCMLDSYHVEFKEWMKKCTLSYLAVYIECMQLDKSDLIEKYNELVQNLVIVEKMLL